MIMSGGDNGGTRPGLGCHFGWKGPQVPYHRTCFRRPPDLLPATLVRWGELTQGVTGCPTLPGCWMAECVPDVVFNQTGGMLCKLGATWQKMRNRYTCLSLTLSGEHKHQPSALFWSPTRTWEKKVRSVADNRNFFRIQRALHSWLRSTFTSDGLNIHKM